MKKKISPHKLEFFHSSFLLSELPHNFFPLRDTLVLRKIHRGFFLRIFFLKANFATFWRPSLKFEYLLNIYRHQADAYRNEGNM